MAIQSSFSSIQVPGYRPLGRGTVGRGTYAFQWNAVNLEALVQRAALETMQEIATDLRAWFLANLHRWSGEMAEQSYARVELQPQGLVIHAGSRSDHTYWHEVRYHPQLRQAQDLFAPQMRIRLIQRLAR